MTCVISVTGNNGDVFLAGDSFCGDDDLVDLCKSPKVFKVGPLGVGVAGTVRSELVLVRSLYNLIPHSENEDITDSWIVHCLPDLVRNDMVEAGIDVSREDSDSSESGKEGEYIIVFDGKTYYFDSCFGIYESRHPYVAIGAGKYLAYGALSFAHKQGALSKNPEKTVLSILDSVSVWSPKVRPPFNVIKI